MIPALIVAKWGIPLIEFIAPRSALSCILEDDSIMKEKISVTHMKCVLSIGKEAVDYLRDNSEDFLILDMITDPRIDGLETYKKILEFHPRKRQSLSVDPLKHTVSRRPKIFVLGLFDSLKCNLQ